MPRGETIASERPTSAQELYPAVSSQIGSSETGIGTSELALKLASGSPYNTSLRPSRDGGVVDVRHTAAMASSVLRSAPLSPTITGALLYALTRAPPQYRERLLQTLQRYMSSKTLSRAITVLKCLFAFGLARNIHIFLSQLAHNNFRLRSERHRYQWNEELAVVTGASGGFGSLITKGLAAKGITVIAVDITVPSEFPADMKSHPKVHYHKCDLTSRDAVMELASKIKTSYGSPSILINNAGVCYQHTILDASEKAINTLFNVNIISHYWTLQAFLPDMIAAKKGHVLATASMASFLTPPGLVAYCNTKAAVMSLHEGLMQEVRVTYDCPEIKFSTVHPTFANTRMTSPFRAELKKAKVNVSSPFAISPTQS